MKVRPRRGYAFDQFNQAMQAFVVTEPRFTHPAQVAHVATAVRMLESAFHSMETLALSQAYVCQFAAGDPTAAGMKA